MRPLGGIFDYDTKNERLIEVQRELEQPGVWDDPQRAQELGQERARLEDVVSLLDRMKSSLADNAELLELVREEGDTDTLAAVEADLADLEKKLGELEFQRMFSGKMDERNAFVDIQSGSGGTEAQDWAEMLLRMYLRWGERRNFKTESRAKGLPKS